MKDFGKWFSDFSPPKQEVAEEEVMLPDGVDEMNDGTFTARCCCCGERREILCDISEIPMAGYEHYCGGSPYCCP